MRHLRVALVMMSIVVIALVLAASPVWAGQKSQEAGKKGKVELPAAVIKALKENCPGAEIDKMDVEKEAGIILYDIEFKAGRGEIEVAADGTVMDVSTIIAMKDVPEAAAEAIQKAAQGATIKQLEKSEIRAEIKKDGEKGTIVIFSSPRHVYEAELEKGEHTGEIQVAPDGKVIEGPKWNAEAEEAEEAKPMAAVSSEGAMDSSI